MAKPKRKIDPASHQKLASAYVDNPDWRPAHDGEKAFPRKVRAVINTRESAIETLFARKVLGPAQKLTADRIRALWEAAGGKTASLDYSQDRIDGGRGDPIVARLQAAQELDRVRKLVGIRHYEVLRAVCGEGRALQELTPHKRERLTMADNLRADLDDVAAMWGMQTRRRA